jgi:hypothetical protein
MIGQILPAMKTVGLPTANYLSNSDREKIPKR